MYSLKVNRIPFSATPRDLKQFFNYHLGFYFEIHPQHHICDVHIPRDKRKRNFGSAFVRFGSFAGFLVVTLLLINLHALDLVLEVPEDFALGPEIVVLEITRAPVHVHNFLPN